MMKHNRTLQDKHPVSRDIGQEVLHAIAGIQFGSVEIIIHESRVVQIECREKIRIPAAKAFSSPNNVLAHQPVHITSTRPLENKN